MNLNCSVFSITFFEGAAATFGLGPSRTSIIISREVMGLYVPVFRSKYEHCIGLIEYFPLYCGIIVYLSEILPDMPEREVVTFSSCTGSYISSAFGTTGLGSVNNFILPVPDASTIRSRLSPFLRVVLEGVTVKSNLPT